MSKNSKSLKDLPTETSSDWKKRLIAYFSLLITGMGIGWLAGLSVSPVISMIITTIIGSAAAIIAAVSGLNNQQVDNDDTNGSNVRRFPSLDTLPIAALVIGLVIGSYFGILARTHDWLEPDMTLEIKKWTNLGVSLKKQAIADKMFNREFSMTNIVSGDAGSASVRADVGAFFADGSNECENLRVLTDDELREALIISAENPHWRALPEIIEDAEVLEELLVRVLCPDP